MPKKLSSLDVVTIRKVWNNPYVRDHNVLRRRLAREYDISERHVLRIARNYVRKEPFVHHYYVHDPKHIDLSKMQDDARSRLAGTGIFRGVREESVIHHHPKSRILEKDARGKITRGEHVSCDGHHHEEFRLEVKNG